MKLLKNTLSLILLIGGMFMLPQQSTAQWSVGASYEIRDVEPENGFGLRVERELLQSAPVAKLGLRAHFSYFSAENSISGGGVTYSSQIQNYDYGVAALGGFSLGLLTPYAGLGLGSTNAEFKVEDANWPGEEGSESNLYWNGFVGAEVSPIPMVKPFIEYRIKSEEEFESIDNNIDPSNGRLIFGVSVSL